MCVCVCVCVCVRVCVCERERERERERSGGEMKIKGLMRGNDGEEKSGGLRGNRFFGY